MLKEVLIYRGSPLIRIRHGFINNSDSELHVKLQSRNWVHFWGSTFNIPLEGSIVRSPAIEADFPFYERDLPKSPDKLEKRWVCFEFPEGRSCIGFL